MAEALAIVGLVSSILTFISFTRELTSEILGVRKSSSGTTGEAKDLAQFVEEIRNANARVIREIEAGGKLSKHEQNILGLVKECENLASRLQDILKKLRSRNAARSKTMEAIRIAALSMNKRGELEQLRRRLEKLSSAIDGHVLKVMQRNQHSTVVAKLDQIESLQRSLEINYDARLTQIREDIVEHLQRKNGDEQRDDARSVGIAKLEILQKEHSKCTDQAGVVRSLHFEVVNRRWRDIPEAEESSNAWLFEPEKTPYSNWLRSEGGMLIIKGKAGSGKSTLMKFASEHGTTHDLLSEWASPSKVIVASYFFWNQGFELQKSQRGLFQSLLYHILRSAPSLVPIACPHRIHHEGKECPHGLHHENGLCPQGLHHGDWEIEELQMAYQRISDASITDTKFCFFVDGLDEYNGPEEDVVNMLNFLMRSPNIKICASTRPRTYFEEKIESLGHTLVISEFTREDMAQYVQSRLHLSSKFQQLEACEPKCRDIVDKIARDANGVWLWVFLVTRDLVHAVDRYEGIMKLQEIVDDFPQELEDYFRRIISTVKPHYRAEMARVFLITVNELQPLPLFSFALLDKEQEDADYALKAPMKMLREEDAEKDYKGLVARLRNRCGDLLSVEVGTHPVFLSHPVDFMHRRVRDFLRDNIDRELRKGVDPSFNPMISLCRIQLFFLKSLSITNLRDSDSTKQVIGLTDELLYYAFEVENQLQAHEDSPVNVILDELDRVNTHYAYKSGLKNHWTDIRKDPQPRGVDVYFEGGDCNFLALMVQARLVRYVRAKLEENPERINKDGRPLLDYALRPFRVTPIRMPYHSQQDNPSVSIDMVRLLLEFDNNKTQTISRPIYSHEDRSVWVLFLLSCWESVQTQNHGEMGPRVSQSLRNAWFYACEELIQAGAEHQASFIALPKSRAQSSRNIPAPGPTTLDSFTIFVSLFGQEKAAELKAWIEYKRNQESQSRLCLVM